MVVLRYQPKEIIFLSDQCFLTFFFIFFLEKMKSLEFFFDLVVFLKVFFVLK